MIEILPLISKFELSEAMISKLYEILTARMDDDFYIRLLYRGSTHNFSNDTFHSLCDKQGPLLVLVKTGKGKLIGGFSSVPWRNDEKDGVWTKDPKCVAFSLTKN